VKRLSRTLGLTLIGLTVVLAAPSGASGAERIGQNGPAAGCGSGSAGVFQDPGNPIPSYSPTSYGVITSWSAMADANPAGRTLQLLVLRPNPSAGANHYITAAKDQVRPLTLPSQLNTFTTGVRLPIEPSERIGLYVPLGQPGGISDCVFVSPGITRFTNPGPEPALNVSMDYPNPNINLRINASAVVEPDTDRDVFGDETQDNCIGTAGTVNGCPNTLTLGKAKAAKNKVTVEATVPGAGTLAGGSANDKTLALTAAKKKKKAKPPLTKSSQTLTTKTSQTVSLTLNLSKAGKSKLAKKGKLGVSIKATYTPIGGVAGVATTSAKLKGKKKKK
jgi:hypothetical protein